MYRPCTIYVIIPACVRIIVHIVYLFNSGGGVGRGLSVRRTTDKNVTQLITQGLTSKCYRIHIYKITKNVLWIVVCSVLTSDLKLIIHIGMSSESPSCMHIMLYVVLRWVKKIIVLRLLIWCSDEHLLIHDLIKLYCFDDHLFKTDLLFGRSPFENWFDDLICWWPPWKYYFYLGLDEKAQIPLLERKKEKKDRLSV